MNIHDSVMKTKAKRLLAEATTKGITGAEPVALYVLDGLDLLRPEGFSPGAHYYSTGGKMARYVESKEATT